MPTRLDPTRTITLRRAFTASMRRRFAEVAGELRTTVPNATDPARVASFERWAKGIADSAFTPTNDNWTNFFVVDAYKRGVRRVFTDVLPPPAQAPAYYAGSRTQFLNTAFYGPGGITRMEQLQDRMDGLLNAMKGDLVGRLTRVYSAGGNKTDKELVKSLLSELDKVQNIRGEVITRTEIVYAHGEGQLDAFALLGVEEIEPIVEWVTTDNPCIKCAPHAGDRYTLDEARGLIPWHPGCLCAWRTINPQAARKRFGALGAFFDTGDLAE